MTAKEMTGKGQRTDVEPALLRQQPAVVLRDAHLAYGERTLRLGVDRHYRWFVEDDAFAPHQYQGVGRTQVDTDVTGKHPHDAVERIAQRHVVY